MSSSSAAAVLVFLPAAAGARFIAADFGQFAADWRELEFHLAIGGLLAIADDGRADAFGTTAR